MGGSYDLKAWGREFGTCDCVVYFRESGIIKNYRLISTVSQCALSLEFVESYNSVEIRAKFKEGFLLYLRKVG